MGRFNTNRGGRGRGGGRGGRGRGGRGRGRGRGSFFVDRSGQDFDESDESRGRIGVLPEDTMSYYRNVLQTLDTGFDAETNDTDKGDDEGQVETDEAKVEFMNNVFSAFKEEAVQVSQNQTVSWIVESLFAQAEPRHLRSVLEPFCKELTLVMFDRFASHVLQALIEYLPAMYQDIDSSSEDENEPEEFKKCVKKLCEFVESHLRDIVTHTYASHVLRSLLEALGGVKVTDQLVRQKQGKGSMSKKKKALSHLLDYSKYPAFSKDFNAWFQTLKDKVIRLCNFEDHLDDLSYTPVLQTVLLVLHKASPEEYAELSSTIVQRTCLDHTDDTESNDPSVRLPHIVQNEIGSYLFELILTLATPQQLQFIFTNVFHSRIMFFCVHSHANYVLQSLLAAVNDAALVSEILEEISVYFEDILAVNHVGIIIKLAGACQRTGKGQDTFLKLLMTAFHCQEPESRQIKVAPLVASFKTFDVFMGEGKDGQEEKETTASSAALLRDVTLHGALLLQQLLRFSKPDPVALSLLQLSATELAFLASHLNGSHVLDAFYSSDTVRPKHRESLLKTMVGVYVQIATSKNGSRCLENIWKACSVQQRILIAEDLCKHLHRLESDFSGKFICFNFGLFKFSHRRKEWLQLQGASNKKQQMLSAVLTGTSKKKLKKKRQEHKEVEEVDNSLTDEKPSPEQTKEDSSATKEDRPGDIEELPETTTSASDRKKRKRKKDKKRLIRNNDSEEVAKSGDVEKKKKNKQKQKQKSDSSDFEKENAGRGPKDEVSIVLKKGKKRKTSHTQDMSEENVAFDEEDIVKKKKKKKKKATGNFVQARKGEQGEDSSSHGSDYVMVKKKKKVAI